MSESEHGWTRHGHACCKDPGPRVGTRPAMVARCGGPALCPTCAVQAAQIHNQQSQT